MSEIQFGSATTELQAPLLPAPQTSTTSLVLDRDSMQSIMMLAEVMASGRATVPKHLQGNAADCGAVIMQAMQWRMNPYAVAQKTHLVNGILGYEAQLVNAVITSMAPTRDRLHFEWYGPWERVIGKFAVKKNGEGKEFRAANWSAADEEGCGVRAWATLRGEDEPREIDLLLTQARTRNSTLWADDPRQQLAYLATKRWSRLYCPDVILGVYTRDELEEVPEKDVTPRRPKSAADYRSSAPAQPIDEALRQKCIKTLEAAAKLGEAALKEAWASIGKEGRKAVGTDKWDAIKATAADSTGPTYADLMARLNAAEDIDEINQVRSDCAHLPETQQLEILEACERKLEA